VKEFEKELLEWMRKNRSELLAELRSKAELDPDMEQGLKTALREFKQSVFFGKFGRKPVGEKG